MPRLILGWGDPRFDLGFNLGPAKMLPLLYVVAGSFGNKNSIPLAVKSPLCQSSQAFGGSLARWGHIQYYAVASPGQQPMIIIRCPLTSTSRMVPMFVWRTSAGGYPAEETDGSRYSSLSPFLCSSRNLLTFTSYKGYGTEIYSGTQSGIDSILSQNRTITVGANGRSK